MKGLKGVIDESSFKVSVLVIILRERYHNPDDEGGRNVHYPATKDDHKAVHERVQKFGHTLHVVNDL